MDGSISFAPLVPWPVLAGFAVVSIALLVFAAWRGLLGWWLRGIAALVLLTALADPSWRQEDRTYLSDIAFVVKDRTASQGIDIRPEQIAAAEAELDARLAELADDPGAPLEVREITVTDATGSGAERGTRLMTALAEAAAEVSGDRIAGAILLTDGQVHDTEVLQSFPAPVHVVLTGRADEWDRRLVVETAPAFAIVGEAVELRISVETLGRAPADLPPRTPVLVSLNGEDARVFEIDTGVPQALPLELDRGGLNVVQITLPEADGELTDRNNTAVLSINGIRDRLRVLLVSGEPYAGERTWRNLLKSDAAVDLVHFTILRPPEKQDGVPVFELSLIAFPTRELFMEKVSEFDLIIFDRYRRRGVLPSLYIENIAQYVRDGGAVLIASGPAFAGAESLYRTPLRDVLPAAPTARVIEEGFVPRIAELGQRHPVTSGLEAFAPRPAEDGVPGWGRWFRLVDMEPLSGNTVMEGPEGRPLLVLDRPGEGRIAMLASDHAWLWSRGYEGGGPQQELLRRLAHWLMQEPELEEEVLVAEPAGEEVIVTRRTLGTEVGSVTVTSPSGEEQVLTLTEIGPGTYEGRFAAAENGVYRLDDGSIEAVTAVGPAAPKEFENPVSDTAPLAALVDATGAGALRLDDRGTPDLRRVRENRVAAGRGWLGLVRREAFDVDDIRLSPLAPGWLFLLLAAGLAFAAWRIEGR
ncbi:MAG: hypothetical protein AAGE76_16395 [Pseudomonadota bacterium]